MNEALRSSARASDSAAEAVPDVPSRTLALFSGPRAGPMALALASLFVLILAYPVHRHIVGALSDFYLAYAPDADRVCAGELPRYVGNPPGYAMLLCAASRLTGDNFTSGKWISLLAAGATAMMTFYLHRRLFGEGPALLAVAILLSSPTFVTYAITPMTDVPFLSLCLGAMLLITHDRLDGGRLVLLAGLTGITTLLRYNGVFLLVPGLMSIIWQAKGRWSRAMLAVGYLAGCLALVAPWAVLNARLHGSPVYNTNYVQAARALDLADPAFASFADVVLMNPGRFAWHYARNIGWITLRTFDASLALLPVGPLAALGIVLSLAKHRTRSVRLVLLATLSFLLFMSLTHWERRYHLFVLASYSGFAGWAIVAMAQRIGNVMNSVIAGRAVVAALSLVILIPSINGAWDAVRTTLTRQPIELLPAADYLDRTAPREATVMSVRAQIAYLSHRPWRQLPFVRSVDELAAAILESCPDYLVYDRWARFSPPFMALAASAGAFSWLRPVYRDWRAGVVIYELRSKPSPDDSSPSQACPRRASGIGRGP